MATLETLLTGLRVGRHIDVTPKLAMDMLRYKSKENRKLSMETMRKYARDMVKGNWKRSHSPIIFGKDFALINGHHRLHAIVMSGVSSESFVVYDDYYCKPEDYLGDEGLKRGSGYSLKLSSAEAAAAKRLREVCLGVRQISTTEIGECWERLEPFYKAVIRRSPASRIVTSTDFVLGVISAAIKTGEYEYCSDTLMKMVNQKVELLSPLPMSLYKQLMIENKKVSQRELTALAFKAFHLDDKDKSKAFIRNVDLVYEEALLPLKSILEGL